jgi:hypothetical protein
MSVGPGLCVLLRIPLPRTPVNTCMKRRIGASASSPDSPTHLGYYGHFFNPPGDVSFFCPGAHLPEEVVSRLPFPGPWLIAANATPETDMLSAITTAAINNVMRFLNFSPPFPLSKNEQPTTLLGGSRLRYWLCPSLLSAHLTEAGFLAATYWVVVVCPLPLHEYPRDAKWLQ